MIRILIVDDEAIVLESVSGVLEKAFEVVIETARNSREGLIKMEHFRPHIIMTDIRMPGMNGLEFIERVRKVDRLVKIIIVSAHDHFEYAKEAVKFGVEDYLLKPLSKSKMIDAVEKVIDKVNLEETLRNNELEHIEKYYQSIQLVESNFFNSIILGRNYMKYINHYREILEIRMQSGYFVVIDFSHLSSNTDFEALNKFNQKMNESSEFLRTLIKYHADALVSHPFLNRVFIYIEKGTRRIDQAFWSSLSEEIIDRFQLNVRIGIGGDKVIDKISESYAEAILALKLTDKNLTTIGDVQSSETSFDHFDELSKVLYDDFISRNKRFKQTLKLFEGEYLKMLGDKNTLEYAEAILIELMVKMQSKCVVAGDPKIHYLTGLLEKLPAQKIQFFEKNVLDWFSLYAKMQREAFNPITIDAIDILQKSFSEELSLEKISENVNVTPQYLSKIFKEDTGVTFKEFLTELRIESAKKLLRGGDVSLKEVGHKVGYNDTSYFIRSFKKHEGITPKDYQRLNR